MKKKNDQIYKQERVEHLQEFLEDPFLNMHSQSSHSLFSYTWLKPCSNVYSIKANCMYKEANKLGVIESTFPVAE